MFLDGFGCFPWFSEFTIDFGFSWMVMDAVPSWVFFLGSFLMSLVVFGNFKLGLGVLGDLPSWFMD